MAISKLILNGETQMDVTSNTNTSNNMLSGVVGTKNDGTSVTGNIASKSSSDLTVSGATVTAPAGYYANAASKAVATATHPNPSASIASATGVVTASHTQDTGYVTGGTTTGTLNLTTQAGKTVTPTESAQTAVALYRWTTGNVNVAAISSTYVGTGVTTRSSANLTASGSVVTAPAGYYSTAATKSIAAGSAFPPAVTITKAPTIGVNTSGVVTASYTGSSSITPTVTSGYISQGTAGTISTTGTSTYQLTSKAAATYYPSTADQTIASQRWLVGNQTIKSVTTSNLTAANIAEGVVVQVGDSANASRITQVTGTHTSGKTYTATIINTGSINYCYVKHPSSSGTKYYTDGDTFAIEEGDIIYLASSGIRTGGFIYVNNVVVASDLDSLASYSYEVPANTSVEITLIYGSASEIYLNEVVDEISITQNGRYNVSEYDFANVNVGGGGFTADQIAMQTIGGSISGNATSIGSYAFYLCTSLTAVSFPSCIHIGSLAFHSCNKLTTISFPLCTTIGSYAFAYCSSLTTVNFPSCTYILSYAFASCSNLTTASFSSATSIGSNTFRSCIKLTTISFPLCTTIGSYAFAYCSSLTTVNFPSCTYIGASAFASCSNLTTASFPSCTLIGSSAFANCYNLLSLYLLGSSVPTLSINVFLYTPIAGRTSSTGGVYGSIFVPSSLYNSYLTATNWSQLSDRIVSM